MLSQKLPSLASSTAVVALSAALVCAGCVGSFHRSAMNRACGEVIGEPESNEALQGPQVSADCDCVHQSGPSCPPCNHEGLTHGVGHQLVRVVCFPCSILHGILNFCAHNEAVGPPDIQAPGRFFPVPTHPVFAPMAEPVAGGPAQP